MSIPELINSEGFLVAAVCICVSCIYFTLVRSKPEKIQNKMFLMIVGNILIAAICNLVSFFAGPYIDSPVGFAFRSWPQFVYFMFHAHLAPLFCFYISIVTGAIYRLNYKFRFIYQAPMFACLILVLINPFTHWIYYFTSDGNYHRNWAEAILYVISIGYYLWAVAMLMLFWSAITEKVRRVMLFFFGVVALGTLAQVFFVGLRTELFSEALAMTGMMITIENEEGRRDSRTGIYNHAALTEDISRYLQVRRSFYLICVKMQNPTRMMQMVGPANIERLTEMTANYLAGLVPRYSIYYIGTGTFVILNESNDREINLDVARMIYKRYQRPWIFQDRETVFNAVVFCAEIPGELHTMKDIMMLINSPLPPNANTNMDIYSGKSLNFILRRSQVENAVLEGMKNGRFEVFYQPIYNIKDMSICAGEALLRLHDETIGDVYPEEFLPLAERGGFIFELGDYVLDEVCKFLNSGIPTEMGIETLNVNLSVVQCMQASYAEHILQITSKYDVMPSRINFEIMESAATVDIEVLKNFVNTLRAKGFRFSMDDYGVGYSNLHSIFSLDVDIIKIDRTILWEADNSENGRVVMESTVDMIRRMNRKILISGVENRKQIELAHEFGVDYLQGFYFSNPINQNEFINVLKATQLAKFEEQKALAASEAMSNFLANMSHEIRTPINAVLGMDEMILRESSDERIQEYARVIEGAGRTLLSLINDILDFSKIEAGNLEIVDDAYNLSTVLIDVINMIQLKADKKGLTLKTDVDPTMPEHLYGDEMRLRQVMLNLLNNAVKYTNEGTVTLKVRCEKLDDKRAKLIVAVKDTGIGIREEDMNKLFEKFHRLDLDKNKTVEGSGLGLAIAHRIVDHMGGEIKVESTYGEGSTFSFFVPQKLLDDSAIGNFRGKMTMKEIPEKEKEKEKHHAFTAPEARVLVVDDTPMNLVVVRELLKKTEIMMDEAMSGAECLKLCENTKYDLILLDYRMPEMDGIETLKHLKENKEGINYDTTVVALTANAIAGAKERFLKEGFDDYITKPVDGNRLEELLLMYLSGDRINLLNEAQVAARSAQSGGWRESLGTGAKRIKDKAGAEEGVLKNPEPGADSAALTRAADYPGLIVEIGIKNCGSRESFERVFAAFQNDVAERAATIRKSLAADDLKRYQVEVHSIKGSARIIGADALSSLAEQLEYAADAEDREKINAETEKLLAMYEQYDRPMKDEAEKPPQMKEKKAEQPAEEKQELTPEKWKDALNTLRVFSDSMDFDNAQVLIEAVRAHKKTKQQEAHIRSMESLIYKLNWDELTELIDKLLTEEVK